MRMMSPGGIFTALVIMSTYYTPGNAQTVQNFVTYYLYTNSNPSTAQVIVFNDTASVQASNYDATKPLRMTIHGYLSDYTAPVNTESRDAYLSTGSYNIIAVDWSPLSHLDYLASTIFTRFVGPAIADFLNWMKNVGFLSNFDKVHLVGHSLGAHISGFCGKALNGILPAIFGLDPAGPNFFLAGSTNRLAATDAKYVQALHTNAGGFGIFEAVGDIDFFPNYGQNQPACGILDKICSHSISAQYFAEAIRTPNNFYAKQCSSAYSILLFETCTTTGVTTQMGSYVQNSNLYGSYYFPVKSSSPYGYGSF